MVEALEFVIGGRRDLETHGCNAHSPLMGWYVPQICLSPSASSSRRPVLGIRVPDELLVVGYDDNHFASESSIPVSTVSLPGYRMGELAVELLLEEIRARLPATWHRTVMLVPHLIPRRSTSRLPETDDKPSRQQSITRWPGCPRAHPQLRPCTGLYFRKEPMSLTWSALPHRPERGLRRGTVAPYGIGIKGGSWASYPSHPARHRTRDFRGVPQRQSGLRRRAEPWVEQLEWRLRYHGYDVTALLEPTSVLGIALGNGWFRGRFGWSGGRALYGNQLAALAQLEIHFPTATCRPS